MLPETDANYESRLRALEEAKELLWDNVEKSLWWNQYQTFKTESEKQHEKVRIIYEHYHPVLVSFKTSFVPTILELRSERVRRVLQYGASRRLISIYHAANTICDIAYPDRTEVATEEEHRRLGDALMIFYVSIPAFFDALSVASHRSLSPSKFGEKDADVFSKKYLEACGLMNLYSKTKMHLKWLKMVKEDLRHHFVHRIPPYVPSAQHNPSEAERMQELQEQQTKALSERRFDDIDGIMNEQQRIGSFCPLIWFFDEERHMPLQSTVLNDLMTFQVASLEIFEELLHLPGFLVEEGE